ncbi:MAG TPA: OB-fold domain-containing protein [Roseiarcus sp.]|nr:OB-fold domain-containing protein [Roseiarcus sp.]
MSDDAKPLGPQAQFKAYLAEGRFMIQRSRSSGHYVFYPRVAVPGSGETDLEWVAASGEATVYAITVNRTREGAYNIALVDLAEGPRMMSRIEGVETAPIGARLKARIAAIEGEPALVFDLAEQV